MAIEFFQANTVMHRLHPITKIVFEIAIFVVAAVFTDVTVLTCVLLVALGVVALSHIPLNRLSYMWVVFFVDVVFIVTQGVWFTNFGVFGGIPIVTHPLFYILGYPFTYEGLVYGISLSLRLDAITLAFPVLVMTTHPGDFLVALCEVRAFGKRMPYNLAFIFVSAIRYVPVMSRAFDTTFEAQAARGVDTESRNPIKSLRSIAPILVPVLVTSMFNAQQLTIALETRAFGAREERTFLRQVRFSWLDKGLIATMIIIAVVSCALAFLGYGQLVFHQLS